MLSRAFHQEVPGGPLNPPPLRWTRRLLWIRGDIARPGLDLDKDECIALSAYEINLTGGTAVITHENTMAMVPQVAGGGALAAQTQEQPAITPCSRPTQVAESLF